MMHATFAAPRATIDTTRRIIVGRIVEYDVETDDGRRIIVEAGALELPEDLGRVKLLRDHDSSSPIGFMVAFDPATGDATFSIPDGPAGDEALAHAASGLRDAFSVGLAFRDSADYTQRDGLTTIHRARVLEVSLLAVPAYGNARVLDVLATATPAPTPTDPPTGEQTMTETLTAADLDAGLEDVRRDMLHAIGEALTPATDPHALALPDVSSLGAYVKALAAGDDTAAAFHAAISDPDTFARLAATSPDANPQSAWIGDAIKLVASRRRVIEFFDRAPLPRDGMTLEYAVLGTDSTAVAEQVTENSDLTGGEITLDSRTADIRTFGGYGAVSRQIIDRAPAHYLNVLFRAMALKYAAVTEAAARAALADVVTAEAATSPLELPATPDAGDWLDVIIDGVELFDERTHALDALVVSKDQFKALAALETTGGDRLMGVYGNGVNQVGEISTGSLTGRLASVDVLMLPGLAAGTRFFADRAAFTTWESAGAPLQLQDENIVNLSRMFSVYGYAAWGAQYPGGIVPIGAGE